MEFAEYLLLSGLGSLTVGALMGLLTPGGRFSRTLSFALTACGSAAILGAAGHNLATGQVVALRLPVLWGQIAPSLMLDRLSSFFVALVALVSVAASVYGPAYAKLSGHGEAPWGRVAYGVFMLAMFLVIMSRDAVSFLFSWELMALSSYLLVISETGRRETARAGTVYLVMTHSATACLTVAFLLWSRSAGSPRFEDWARVGASVAPVLKNTLFGLLLVGFGAKAGVIPLHIWLPEAHPAAPSHVSALMSGVMLKTAVYGLLRFGLTVLGPVWAGWGIIVLALGLTSAIIGVLYALTERDLKRLLAYSSVENVGIILMAIGAALLAVECGLKGLAGLALTAALFHSLNHALFKSMLFLSAGAVVAATGTRDMDRMGGLIRRMPRTAAAFMVGSLAIAAIPPLNGFVSEWLTFQTLVGLSTQLQSPLVRLFMPLAASGLALTGALAAYTFVKAFGSVFLAMPRSARAAGAVEAPPSMWMPAAFMGALSVAAGLWPAWPLRAIAATLGDMGLLPVRAETGSRLLPFAGRPAPVWVALALSLLGLAAWVFNRAKSRPARVGETWNCGHDLDCTMEYTSTAFSQPARTVFRSLLRPEQRITRQVHSGTPFTSALQVEERLRPVYEDWLYRPARSVVIAATGVIRRLQVGRVQYYLWYMFTVLAVLLILAKLM